MASEDNPKEDIPKSDVDRRISDPAFTIVQLNAKATLYFALLSHVETELRRSSVAVEQLTGELASARKEIHARDGLIERQEGELIRLREELERRQNEIDSLRRELDRRRSILRRAWHYFGASMPRVRDLILKIIPRK